MATYIHASIVRCGDTLFHDGKPWIVDHNLFCESTGTQTIGLSNADEFTEIYLLPASPVMRITVAGIDTTPMQHLSLADSAMAAIMDLAALAGRYDEIQFKFQSAVAMLESLGYSYNGEWSK